MNTKLLRQQILDLAIRGKLVKQDPNDEPASVLLERIRAEKEQLIQQGKIKKTKAPATTDTPHYQNTPNGWAVCRLEDILDYEQPTSYIVESTDYRDEYETPVLTAGKSFILGHTNETSGIYSNVPVIIFDDFTTDSRLVDFPFKVKSSAMKILQVRQGINIQYVAYFMSITRLVGDTHKRYWISEYSKLSIPLPPLAEQRRIVAEVEKWFALIDDLEANKQDLQVAIRQVRAKVLDLAIHGKLVPQDPNDEPAIDLLHHINPHFAPSDTSHYENIPDGWEVCRLEDIVDVLDNKRKPIKAEERAKRIDGKKNLYPYYGATGFVGYIDEYLIDGEFILLGEDGAPFLDRYATKAYAVNGKIWVNNHAHILLPKINFEYMLHYLNAIDYTLYAKGTTRLKLTQGDMSKILVLLPPIEEQKRISNQLAKIFNILHTISAEL